MFTVRVEPDNAEPYEITAKARDVVRWEAMDKRNSLAALESNLRMSDLFGLTYAACKRAQRFAGTYSEFLDTHDIEPLDEDGNNPQQAAAAAAAKAAEKSAAGDASSDGDGEEDGPGPTPELTVPAP